MQSMKRFKYKARTKDGDEKKGRVEARDMASAVNVLREKGWVVISIDPLGEAGGLGGLMRMFQTVKLDDVVMFTRQLSTMVASGLPLTEALSVLEVQSAPAMGKVIGEMLQDIQKILNPRIGQKIESIDILDIMNMIGKCVVAGNLRRSAEIALGEATDLEFITSKQDEEKLYSHRWASNNSIFAFKGLDYSFIADQIAVNGEPGIFWLDNAKAYSRMKDEPDYKDKKAAGVNPCGEQTLESFELCCLVETFPSRHESYEEFQETLKFAYLYAKSVTLVNTHWQETNAVMLKNRRMGVSQTGIIEAFVKHGRRKMLEWCDKGYNYLQNLDEQYSGWLCIPRSIKITTVKPSGTVSLLPGVPPGIHYPHSEYYIRRIRISKNSDLIALIKNAGYFVEDDSYSPNTVVVEFPVHEKYFDRSKNEVSIWEQAENASDYQKYWSDNQVSITITFQPDEADQIKHVLECFEDKLKSASFLPIKEHGYKQAPYEEITKEKFEEMVSKIKPMFLDETKDRAIGEKFCDSDRCEVTFEP